MWSLQAMQGLGLAVGVPMYVVAMDRSHNRLIVGTRDKLLRRHGVVTTLNWVSIEPPTTPLRASVKIRARHEPAAATITPREDGACLVEFDEPQSAVTPGQAAVFYDGDVVLGGGWIVQ